MFIPDLDFFSIPDPGVKKAPGPRIRNTDEKDALCRKNLNFADFISNLSMIWFSKRLDSACSAIQYKAFERGWIA